MHLPLLAAPFPPPGRPGSGPRSEETFYDAVKRGMVARQVATRALLDGMDPLTRLAMEGYRPGAYVRMRLTGARPGVAGSGGGASQAGGGIMVCLNDCGLGDKGKGC